MIDIGRELVDRLQREFFRLLRYKTEQFRLESRLRNIRFIGELTKFKVAPPIVALRCWHATLITFNSISIPVCCALLDTCGRWLFRNAITHARTQQLLEQMINLKKTK